MQQHKRTIFFFLNYILVSSAVASGKTFLSTEMQKVELVKVKYFVCLLGFVRFPIRNDWISRHEHSVCAVH